MAWKNDYDDLMKDIASSGQTWSRFDLDLAKQDPDAGRSIYTQKDLFGKAGTDEERQAAHDAAEAIRQRYGGYSGGKDGGSFTLSDKYAPPMETYDPSKYGPQIDELLGEIMGRDPFQYSPGADPSYQSYSEKYRNLGRQAREDALGSAASMTGGQLSSFAMTAGQQAQNAYNAQLSDKIPELERMAYDMYLGELGQKRSDLAALQGLDATDYGRFRDRRDDRLTNYQLNYQVGRDELGDARYADETAYQREQDALQWAYQKDADHYDRALGKWQLTGVLDEESAKVLGLPAGTKTSDYQYQLAQTARMAASGGGRSSGNGKGGGEDAISYQDLYDAGLRSEGDAYLWLVAQGYSSAEAAKIAGYFSGWMKDGGGRAAVGVDMESVIGLGYGPISAEELADLEDAGEVVSYDEDGKIKFRKSGKRTVGNLFGGRSNGF